MTHQALTEKFSEFAKTRGWTLDRIARSGDDESIVVLSRDDAQHGMHAASVEVIGCDTLFSMADAMRALIADYRAAA